MGCVFSKDKNPDDKDIDTEYSLYLSDSEIADIYWREYNSNKRFC